MVRVIPKTVKQFGSAFIRSGFQFFLVGGAVRNKVAGLPVTDYDFATDASPDQVMELFPRVIPTGVKHGTVTVLFKDQKFEVTTFRVEGKYSDSRRPDSISFTPSILEDLKRRDFTINSMAIDIKNGKLLDPHNGKKDIKDKIIRAIGDPEKRFNEDGLRILRACRFSAELGFSIEGKTLEGMKSSRNRLSAVSAERIRTEFEKIILSDAPSRGISMMDRSGILEMILPELNRCKGVEQKGYHEFDVYDHSLHSCDRAENNIIIRLAALFHDIGKPAVLGKDEQGITTFYQHEKVSACMTSSILRRLKFPKSVEKSVVHLIAHHMFLYEPSWTDAAVRRFLHRVGIEHVEYLLMLRDADQQGMRNNRIYGSGTDEFRTRIQEVIEKDTALTTKDLEINGNDLFTSADIPKGPVMGKILDFLMESVIEDPELNTKSKLIEIAEKYYKEYFNSET